MDRILLLASSRIIATQLVQLLFAAATWAGIILPATVDKPRAVAAMMLAIAAFTAVLRFGHAGAAAADAKAWWRSKIIWTQIVAAGFALLVLFGVVPGVEQASVVEFVMGAIAIVTALFRAQATTQPIG